MDDCEKAFKDYYLLPRGIPINDLDRQSAFSIFRTGWDAAMKQKEQKKKARR